MVPVTMNPPNGLLPHPTAPPFGAIAMGDIRFEARAMHLGSPSDAPHNDIRCLAMQDVNVRFMDPPI